MDTDYEQPLGRYSTHLYRFNGSNVGGTEVYGRGRPFRLGLKHRLLIDEKAPSNRKEAECSRSISAGAIE
ncbi:MAG TPA: hypothetical protein VNR51_08570 [Hyphomicrobium sp.]|nr:hypothetical protein [Hyphomicrobium sp.]